MNDILYHRIIKLIAITYALNEDELLKIFTKTQSIDKILDMIKIGELK